MHAAFSARSAVAASPSASPGPGQAPSSNFAARIAEAAVRFPDRVAIEEVGDGGRIETTYGALMARAIRWAASLVRLHIQPGDRVAILAENDTAWVAAYLGILHVGAVAVPLDTAYAPEQVSTVVANCGAVVLIASLRQLERRSLPAARGSGSPVVLNLSDTGPESSTAEAPPPLAGVTPADAALILYTSGTTADPKGVVLTHGNLEAERVAALAVIDCTERDAVLGVLPLFHSLAQVTNLVVPLSVGARVVFLDTVSSSTLLAALQDRAITIFACVPQFFYLIHQRVMTEVGRASLSRRVLFRRLLGANGWLRTTFGWNPGRRWFGRIHRTLGNQVRLLITGGSRFDPAIGRDLYEMGFTILNGYGLTETTGAATVQRPADRFTTSVGQPLPGVDVRIDRPKASRPMPSGPELEPDRDEDRPADEGEILIRGPVVMREYFNRPDATAEVVRDGWLHTGDLGRVDADGRLYITGRQKEVIVLSSGKNLYPEEIEAHYRRSPFVKELCVLGLVAPGQPTSERLHAVVVPDEQALGERGTVNVRELIRFELEGLSVHLPPHKRILSYDIQLDPLPRTTTGKLRRRDIERRLTESGRQDAATSERPPSDEELSWLSDSAHADAVAAVAGGLGRPTVLPNENLELDLGLDSLERVELMTMLEQRAGTSVSADARARIFTVRQLIDAVSAAEPRAKSGPTATSAPRADSRAVRPAWNTILAETPDPQLIAGLRSEPHVRAVALFGAIKILAIAFGLVVGLRVLGRDRVPREGALILAPNHQSFLDGFVLAAALPFRVFRRLFFVGAAELFVSPFMRWIARLVNIVPVDPDANLVTAMQAAAAGLRLNKILMLFPEGERSIDGTVRPFRKGAATLAAELDVPLVPVALDGLYPLWPRSRPFNWRGLLPWRRRRVSLMFGAPLSVSPGDYGAGTARLQESVKTMFGRLSADRR